MASFFKFRQVADQMHDLLPMSPSQPVKVLPSNSGVTAADNRTTENSR
jgi:hypothetical protein